MNRSWNRKAASKGPPPGVTLFDPTKFQDKNPAPQPGFAASGGAPQYSQVGGQNAWGGGQQGTQGEGTQGTQGEGTQGGGGGGGWNSWSWDANSWGGQNDAGVAVEQLPKLSGQTPPPQQQHQHPQPQQHQQQQQQHQHQQHQQQPLQQDQNHYSGQQHQQGMSQQWEQHGQQQYDQWNAWSQSNQHQQQQQQPETGGTQAPAGQLMQGMDQHQHQQHQQQEHQQQQPQQQQQEQQHQQHYDQWNQQQYWQGQGSNQGMDGSNQWGTGDGQWPQQYGGDQTGYSQGYGQYGQQEGGDAVQGHQAGEVQGVQQQQQQGYTGGDYSQQGFETSSSGQQQQQQQQDGQQFPPQSKEQQQQAAVLESFSSESVVNDKQGFLQLEASGTNPPQGHSSPMVNFFSPESSGQQSDFLQQSGSSDFLQQSAGSESLDQSSGTSDSLDRSATTRSSTEQSESSPPRELGSSQPPDQFGSLPGDGGPAPARIAPSLDAPPIVAPPPQEGGGGQEMARGLSVGFAVPEDDESHLKVNAFMRTDSGISNASLSTLNYSVSSTSLEDQEEKQAVDELADQMDSVSLGDDQSSPRRSGSDYNQSAAGGQGTSTAVAPAVEEDVQSSSMGDWEFVQKAQSLTSSSSQHSRASSLDQAVAAALVGTSAEGGGSSSEEPSHPSAPPQHPHPQHPPPRGSPHSPAVAAPQLGNPAPPAASVPLQGVFQPAGEGRTLGDASQQAAHPGMTPGAVLQLSTTAGGVVGSGASQLSGTRSVTEEVSITETTRALEEMTAGLTSLVQDKDGAAGQGHQGSEARDSRPSPQDLAGRGRSGANPLPDMFKNPSAPPKTTKGSRPPPASPGSAAGEGPPTASLASHRRQPGSGHSSAFSKVPTSRARQNMSPATTLWENPEPPAANILLAPAVVPVLAPVAPVASSAPHVPSSSLTTTATSAARSPALPSLVQASKSSTQASTPAGADSSTSLQTESSVALSSHLPPSRGEGRQQGRQGEGRRGRGYGDDSRHEDDARSLNSLDELDAVAEPVDDPRDRRGRDYYGYDPRYDKEGYDRRRYRDRYRERYGDDRYERPRSRHEDDRPSSRNDRPSSRGELERPHSRGEVDRDRRYRYDYDRDPYRDHYRGYAGYDYYSRGDYYRGYYDPYYGGQDTRYARGYQEEMRYRHPNYQERYPQDYWGRPAPGEGYDQSSLYSGSRGNTPGPDDSRLGYEDPNSEHYHSAYGYDPYTYEYYHGEGYGYSSYQQEYTPGRMTPHKYNIPHVRACFGPGGQLVKVMPNRPADGQPAVVEMHDVSAMVPDCPTREELADYPGPLLRNETHKNDVLLFCQKKVRACMENIDMVDRESAELIWRLLELMIKQNGTLVGSDLAELLLAGGHEPGSEEYEGAGGLRITTSTEEGLDTAGLDHTDAVADYSLMAADRSQINAGRSRGEITGRFRHLLLYGRKKDALEWAMKNDLWGHALFLASKMDNRTHASVMTRFANNAMRMNDPLQSLYQLMSGRQPAAVTCVCDEGWGDWRPHLAMLLSNHTQRTDFDRKCIASLGDTLASKGFLHASHFCYLMAQCKFGSYSKKTSKLVLIGANHYLPVMEFATNEAIQCTEVFEYAQSLGQPEFIIPHFQLYKFLYATRLAEYGFPQEALHYCEVIAQNINASPALYQPTFVRLLYNLSSQLKMHDPQLQQGGSLEEDGEEPGWLASLSRTLAALQDGSIQPASGQATPSLPALTTAASSESGDLTSASLDNYPASTGQYQQQQGGYTQQQQQEAGGYGQEGYGYNGEASYSQDAAAAAYLQQQQQQQQQYGYQQQGSYGALQPGLEGFGQSQVGGEGQAGQAGQTEASGTETWDASQSAQVPPMQGYSQQQWEGHYAQTYAHQFMSSGAGDTVDGSQPQTADQGEGGFPPQQPGGQRGSFASTGSMPASVTASMEDEGKEDENAEDGEQGGGSSFDYFGAATSQKIIAPPSRFRTNSTSSTGSRPRQRTVSESSTGSLSVANPKPRGDSANRSQASPKKGQAPTPGAAGAGSDAQKNQKGGGWFGGLFSKFSKPKNEIKLPDDKNPSIVWDPVKQRWMNTEEGTETNEAPPPPPPRDADISGPPPPGGMAPPSGNRFSLNRDRGGLSKKYVDVLNPGKSNGNPPVPGNIFSVLPPSSSTTASTAAPPAILNPSGPGMTSSQGPVPSVIEEQPAAGGEPAEQPAAGPPAGPMLFNPAQFQNSTAPSHAASAGGPKFGQRRKYPKQ